MFNDNIYIDALACTNEGIKYTNEVFYGLCEKYFFPKIESRHKELYQKLLLKEPSHSRYFCDTYEGESWDKLNTADKMNRYDHFAKKMSLTVAKDLLSQAGTDINDIDLVVVNQTTGNTLPSISTYLLSEIGCSRNTLTLNIGYMGCSAALIALDTAARFMRSDPRIKNAIVISLEVTSSMLSPRPLDTVILGNTLFGDGAAGVVLTKKKSSKSLYKIEAIQRTTMITPKSINAIKFASGENYYEVNLSRDIPVVATKAMKENLQSIVPRILSKMDKIKHLCKAKVNWTKNVDHWAIHPGGMRILEFVQNALALADGDMESSHYILKNYRNMSSPTVLFIMRELLKKKPKKNDRTVAIAFGSGFKCNSASFLTAN